MPTPDSNNPAAAPDDGCPVDHHARAAWLEKAAQAGDARRAPHPMPPHPPAIVSSASGTTSASSAASSSSSSTSSSWTSWLWSSASSSSPSRSAPSSTPAQPGLGNDREVSTIPRAPTSPASANQPLASSSHSSSSSLSSSSSSSSSPSSSPSQRSVQAASHGSLPSNSESESGASASGHWIYPSERMFFEAMRRKQFAPEAADMASVVPIHNAVNERAWLEIRAWEARFAGARAKNARCGGPRLASFSGDSRRRTPRARLNGLLGYQEPFDRHDWVVERCHPADTVEYVIDFYQGRDVQGTARPGLSFYLDVRPKLNTWEGCRMRALSLLGW